MKKLLLITALAAAPVLAHAEDAAEEALETRQGYFLLLGANMNTLAGMAKGEIDYDEAAAVTAATNIETLTNYNATHLFANGISSDTNEDSEALPKIWDNMADFGEKAAALKMAAVGAGEAVKGGQANVGPVLQKIGGTCKGCHDEYRKK